MNKYIVRQQNLLPTRSHGRPISFIMAGSSIVAGYDFYVVELQPAVGAQLSLNIIGIARPADMVLPRAIPLQMKCQVWNRMPAAPSAVTEYDGTPEFFTGAHQSGQWDSGAYCYATRMGWAIFHLIDVTYTSVVEPSEWGCNIHSTTVDRPECNHLQSGGRSDLPAGVYKWVEKWWIPTPEATSAPFSYGGRCIQPLQYDTSI